MKSGIPYKDAQAWCRQLDDRHNRGAGPMRPRPEDSDDHKPRSTTRSTPETSKAGAK